MRQTAPQAVSCVSGAHGSRHRTTAPMPGLRPLLNVPSLNLGLSTSASLQIGPTPPCTRGAPLWVRAPRGGVRLPPQQPWPRGLLRPCTTCCQPQPCMRALPLPQLPRRAAVLPLQPPLLPHELPPPRLRQAPLLPPAAVAAAARATRRARLAAPGCSTTPQRAEQGGTLRTGHHGC